MSRRDQIARRNAALPAMGESALANGGVPNFKGLSRELGTSPTTLRRWWYLSHPDAPKRESCRPPRPKSDKPKPKPKRAPKPKPKRAPKPKPKPKPKPLHAPVPKLDPLPAQAPSAFDLPVPALSTHLERAQALLAMSRADLAPQIVAEVLHEREQARALQAAAVAGRLTSELPKVLAMFRDDTVELDEENIPREEFELRLSTAAAGMPDRDLELVMAAYAERHNGRILFVGAGGHRAELIDGEWAVNG